MSVCPSCGVEVREGKAFCYNCGAPMSQSAARRDDKHSPDLFKATVVAPPPPRAPQPNAAPLEMSGRAGAGRTSRRKFFYGKFGLGVVALLLLVLLVLFALAVLVN